MKSKSGWENRIYIGTRSVFSCHVESVVLLNRQDISTSIEIELTAEDLELTRIESKATYKEIEMYVKNKFGLVVIVNSFARKKLADTGSIETAILLSL